MSRLVELGVRELRAAPMTDATVSEAKNGDLLFEGYAAVYEQDSEPMVVRSGGQLRKFVEQNVAGSFDKVLATNPDVRLLGLNHDENHVLARTKSGTLDLESNRRGLLTKARVAPTTYAHDLRMSVERGDVDAMSYGFEAAEDAWDETDPLLARRSVIDYRMLYDVSPVTFPAFRQTEAAFRSLEAEVRSGALPARELRALLDSLERPASPESAGDALSGASEERGLGPECAACKGSGDCAACAGTGKAGRGARSARATQLDCGGCYGMGTCRACQGTGVTPHSVDASGEPADYRTAAVARERRRRHLALTP